MNISAITKIEQPNLRESAYNALRDAFIRGEFAPGDSVSQRDLAEKLGISMTPVREAVRQLVAEGALIDAPRRMLVVPQFSKRRMSDLKSARLALETLIFEQAFGAFDAPAISKLDDILSHDHSAGDPGLDLQKNYAFHFALYRQAGSEVLIPMIEGLWVQYGTYLNLISRQSAALMLEEDKYHHEIVAALKAGDKAAAITSLRLDIERSFDLLRD